MNHLKKSQLKLLLQEQTPPCVSIYLPLGGQKPPEDPPLGAARSGEVASDGGLGVELDYIELLLNAKRLLAEDYEAAMVDKIIDPLLKVNLDEWKDRSRGTLCLFRSPETSALYVMREFAERLAVVANSFHIRPLTELLQSDRPRTRDLDRALQALHRAQRQRKLADTVRDVLRELHAGRVRSLFVAENEHLWGRLNWETEQCTFHGCQLDAHDDDILDELVEHALVQDVSVFEVPQGELPTLSPVAAILTEQARRP